jgi:hypothetical protein
MANIQIAFKTSMQGLYDLAIYAYYQEYIKTKNMPLCI